MSMKTFFSKLFKRNKPLDVKDAKGEFKAISTVYEDGQIILETDWDNDFIEYLRSNGYNGSDEQIIQKHLVLLNKEILQEMGELNNDDFI